MSTDDAFRQLQQGNAVSCVTPDGVRFQIQSKLDSGIAWYRAFPARKGRLNRYSRLSDRQLRELVGFSHDSVRE